MAATKPSQAKPSPEHAQKPFCMENSIDNAIPKRLASSQASYATPKPSTEHAQWKFQTQAIKAASNDALPLTPNQTSPCTHRSYHLGSIALLPLFGF